MRSLRRHEGYLLIDHRESPGIGEKGALLGPSTLVECPIYTCSHCQRGVILNPQRTRDRGYCPKCDHVICDECEAARVASAGECIPFKRTMDEMQEAAERLEQMARATVLIA